MRPEVRILVGVHAKLNEVLINLDNAVSFYRFDEFGSTIARDRFRNRNDGEYLGTGYTPGVIIPEYPEIILGVTTDGNAVIKVPNDGEGYGLPGDGAPRNLSLAQGQIGFYFIANFTHNSATERVLAQKYNSGTGNGWRIIQVNGGLTFRGYNSTALVFEVSTGAINDGTTKRVYLGFSPSDQARAYVNGTQVDSDATGATELDFTTSDMYILAADEATAAAGNGFIGTLSSLLISRTDDSGIPPGVEAIVGWTDISDDWIVGSGIKIRRGIQSKAITARMASAATCQLDLNNSSSNSHGLEGAYSPRHANQLGMWGNNTPIKVDVWDEEDSEWKTQFRGRIANIDPDSDPHGPKICSITATSWLGYSAVFPIGAIPIHTNILADDAFRVAVDYARLPPPGVQTSMAENTFPFAFDQIRQNTSVSQVLNLLTISELTYTYELRDGTLVFESGQDRLVVISPTHTVNLTMNDVKAPTSTSDIINIVKAEYAQRKQVTGQTVYVSPHRIKISLGQTQDVTIRYRDPDQRAQQVSAIDIEPLLPNVHYTMNTAENGGGTNITADLVLSYAEGDLGGTEARITLTNNSAFDGWVSFDAIIGTLLLTYERIELIEYDDASINANGPYEYSLQQPYIENIETVRQAAQRIKAAAMSPVALVGSLRLRGDQHMHLMLTADVGDSVGIGNSLLALSPTDVRFINGVNMDITEAYVEVDWVMTHALTIINPPWLIGVVGNSEVGQTTYIG